MHCPLCGVAYANPDRKSCRFQLSPATTMMPASGEILIYKMHAADAEDQRHGRSVSSFA